jgi:hypothetical protein
MSFIDPEDDDEEYSRTLSVKSPVKDPDAVDPLYVIVIINTYHFALIIKLV